MAYGTAPTHWYVHDCQFCYKRSFISIEDEWDTDDRFCPNCGISSEVDATPHYDSDDTTVETLDYDEDYEE